MSNDLEKAKTLAAWKESMRDRWSELAIGKVDITSRGDMLVGGKLDVRSQIRLGSIDPADITAELYYGLVDADGNISSAEAVPMEHVGEAGSDDLHIFTGSIPCRRSGLCGFTVRLIPSHPDLVNKYDTGLIRWEDSESPAKESKPAPAEAV